VADSSGSEDDSARKQQKKPVIKLKRDKDGYPLLPSFEEIKQQDLSYKKHLIGKFIGDIYRS
jgi:hypothetical protein